ncbi:type VII secretion system (Wss) protein ESAT-6 [Prauserella shujinwangii]|uniref:Type VII secretion system (Wss) protein ESAT-6 n=1 Tax=Prauserella shujinwangii TaxID=1453103 RepID=A0A2T0LNT2_9PSEU|nr:WXG100 family type VII secretion target [Prauserella shujinwangii]PRX44910.1 type VII secretion system (Wss) protein ESAT-6 [Prauserella shujinwangii]
MTAYADVEDPAAVLAAGAGDRPGRQSTKELIEKAGWKIQGVNWIYEKVTGENLVEALINPLLGDFEKIDANAHAWNQVSKALDSVRHNLDAGVDQLGNHWQGDAADSFARRMDTMWAVAVEADSQVARIIGDKFKSMANTCRTATSVALALLDKLVTKLMEAAMTAWIPVVGWGKAVWMVYDAVQIVDAIRKIIISIQTLIEGVQGMVDGIMAMGTALMKIKDIRDVNDALDVLDSYQDGKEKYSDGAKAAKSGALGTALGGYGLHKSAGAAGGRYSAPSSPSPAPGTGGNTGGGQ